MGTRSAAARSRDEALTEGRYESHQTTVNTLVSLVFVLYHVRKAIAQRQKKVIPGGRVGCTAPKQIKQRNTKLTYWIFGLEFEFEFEFLAKETRHRTVESNAPARKNHVDKRTDARCTKKKEKE